MSTPLQTLTLSDGRKLIAINPAGLSEGDIIQLRSGAFVRIPRGAAVADVAVSPPADSTIAALTISDPPTQAEVQALRDQCETLRDSLAAAIATIETLRDRLDVTSGNGLIAD